MINVKAISTNVGKALLVSALFMFISLMISIYEGMDSAFTPLLISFIISCKLSEEPEQVADFCRRYIKDYKHDFQNSAVSHKKLLNLTLRYLERTRR